MGQKKSSIRKVTIVKLSGSHYAFTSVSKAAEAVKIMSSAIFVERDFDYKGTLFRPADTAKYSWMGEIEMQTNVNFSPSLKEEIIEPEVLPVRHRPRLQSGSNILRLH